MKKKKIDGWALEDSENTLSYDIDDAIQEALAEITESQKEIPETLRIAGYVLKKPDVKSTAEESLRELLSSLDYSFRDLDNMGFTEPTEKMKKAAVRFVKEVLKDYELCNFEQECTKEINVKRWLKRNSDWYQLKGEKNYGI